jgi:hypothetical protein
MPPEGNTRVTTASLMSSYLADAGGVDHADDWPVRVAARAEDYVTADTDDGRERSLRDGIHGVPGYLTCNR